MELDMNTSRDKSLTIRLSDEELDIIHFLSYQFRKPRAHIVRKAIMDYYELHNQED